MTIKAFYSILLIQKWFNGGYMNYNLAMYSNSRFQQQHISLFDLWDEDVGNTVEMHSIIILYIC